MEDQYVQLVKAIGEMIYNLEKRMNERFDRLEKRLDALENRMDALEKRMDTLENRMDKLECRMDKLENYVYAMDEKLSKDINLNRKEITCLREYISDRLDYLTGSQKIVLDTLARHEMRLEKLESQRPLSQPAAG